MALSVRSSIERHVDVVAPERSSGQCRCRTARSGPTSARRSHTAQARTSCATAAAATADSVCRLASRPDRYLVGVTGQRPSRSTALMSRLAGSPAKYLINGGMSVSTRSRMSLRAADIRQQPVGRVDGVGDVVALLVELGGKGVQLAEQRADLVGPPVDDVVDLVLHHLQVRDAPAAQDYRNAGQRLLGGRIRRRILQRDGVAVLQQLRRRVRRCGQLHVLGAQQAGLADLGGGVLRQLDALLHAQRQGGDPVLQLDGAIEPTKTSATMTLLLPLIASVSGICT